MKFQIRCSTTSKLEDTGFGRMDPAHWYRRVEVWWRRDWMWKSATCKSNPILRRLKSYRNLGLSWCLRSWFRHLRQTTKMLGWESICVLVLLYFCWPFGTVVGIRSDIQATPSCPAGVERGHSYPWSGPPSPRCCSTLRNRSVFFWTLSTCDYRIWLNPCCWV